MAEGHISEEDMEGSIFSISKEEFDVLWQDALKKYEKLWEGIKKRYPIGAYVQEEYKYAYPQGLLSEAMILSRYIKEKFRFVSVD